MYFEIYFGEDGCSIKAFSKEDIETGLNEDGGIEVVTKYEI